MIGLALIVAGVRLVATGNEQIVRLVAGAGVTREDVIEQRDHLAGSSESESTELARRLETMVRLRGGGRSGGEQSAVAEQLVSLIAPDSFAADQYRSLRHSVERLHKDGLHVLAVTSPGPGDGKSVTAANLAGAPQSPDARC